jgi:hypothetical protein
MENPTCCPKGQVGQPLYASRASGIAQWNGRIEYIGDKMKV